MTDLGDNAPAKDFKTRLSLVMLSGIVRDTTDATLEIEDIADVYYASQPKKLFSLSRNQREAIEVGDDGAVVSRLSLKPHVDEPIAMTFSPDGAKMMVLGSDGDLHIFAAKGCGASQQGMHRRALKQQQVMPGRRVLGIPGGPPAANDGMIGTGLVSSGQNPSSWLAQLSAETAKHADSQNDIYLYYSRLALHNKNYLAMYSLCEAHNITEPTSGRAYSGLAFNDMRKTVWTITGSPPMMAEYNIAGTLERDVSLGSSATSSRPTGRFIPTSHFSSPGLVWLTPSATSRCV